MQHVEALLAHAQDHDDDEDPEKLLRDAVAAVAMTIELLTSERQPSVDFNVLAEQLVKRASS